MRAPGSAVAGPGRRRASLATGESRVARYALIGVAVAFLGLFLVLPLALVLQAAFSDGIAAYFAALQTSDTLSAVKLTVLAALIAVPINAAFGVAAGWLIAHYDFRGKSFVVTLIDLPFSVSPVIAGLVFVLLFGARSWLGPILLDEGIQILFAPPAIVLASTFVTLPIVAREVIAVLEAQGSDEEEAALTLGASGPQILWRVTLPKIRWGLLYGVILCNARAMGEFGAVSVVSGHIRGETNTLPLHVEILYNEYAFSSAFAVASVLALLSLVTLAAKQLALWLAHRRPAPPAEVQVPAVPAAVGGAS